MKSAIPLPDPDSEPGRDIVIYDGNCHFCTKSVVSLRRMDICSSWLRGREVLSFISLHDPRVGERFPELTHDMLMEQMYVIGRDRTMVGGADAVRYLTRRLPALWWAAPCMHIPGTARLWRWAYQKIARQRYRWNRESCDDGACAVHFDDKR